MLLVCLPSQFWLVALPNRLPPLPKSGDEAKSGWESARPDSRIVCKPLPAAEGIVFEAVTEAPENKIYLSSSSAK